MLLSKINPNNLNDEKMNNIVFEGIEDTGLGAKYGLIFGNQKLMQQRVAMAVKLYNDKRIKKIIFMGGSGIAWNDSNITIPESLQMKNMAITLGIPESDIIIEDKSMNSIENAINTTNILKQQKDFDELDNLILITSEFHLKRAMLSFKKYLPNLSYTLVATKDGLHDKDNWKDSEEGRKIIDFEAKRLIELAKNNQIEDIIIDIDTAIFHVSL
jgi:uncharacterized SAM-binding protein YcdF (DUF218 family)